MTVHECCTITGSAYEKMWGGGGRRGEERYYNLLVQAAVKYTAQWTMTPIKITLVTRYQRGNVYFLDNEYGGVQ